MKKRYVVLIIVVVLLVLGFITAKIVLGRFDANLKELAQTEISEVDLASAKDGYYTGTYSSFPVSVEVGVTVKNHVLVDIVLIKHNNGQGQRAEIIPGKVIKTQSLKVDSVSGATYSSKVILKAIEDALVKAAA